nr:ATP-binding protein [Candidatus Sigynarchaeota archaeon]
MEFLKNEKTASQAWDKMFALLNVAIIITDTKGTIKYANNLAEKMLGVPKQELPGMVLGKVIENALSSSKKNHNITTFIDNACQEASTPEPREHQVDIETMDHKAVQIRSYCLKIDETGDSLPVFIIDSTAPAMQAESLYWESLEKLWESSRGSIEILRSIPSAIFITKIKRGGKLAIVDCNPAAERMGKKALADLQGTSIDAIWAHASEKTVIKQILEGNETGTPFTLEYIDEKDNVLQKAYKVQIFFMPNDRVGVIFDDITNQKKAEKLLEEENIKLKELDTIKNNFIAITSHELKTPLVSTCGASEFLLNNYRNSLGKEELKFVEMINRGANRLKQLVNSLLDMSRLQSGQIELSLKEDDLVGILKHVVEDQAYMLQLRNQQIVLDTPERLVFRFDPARGEQILTNLITNAIKNTQQGGKIEVRIASDDKEVMISVVDNGVGITKDEMDKLFTRFGKISREGVKLDLNIQGTGLGLYITREIVTLHNGRIWAESEGRYKGAKFIVVLPLKPKEPKKQPVAVPPVSSEISQKPVP